MQFTFRTSILMSVLTKAGVLFAGYVREPIKDEFVGNDRKRLLHPPLRSRQQSQKLLWPCLKASDLALDGVFLVLGISLLAIGCAGAVGIARLTPDHPASPDAPEVAFSDPSAALRPDSQDAMKAGSGGPPGPGKSTGGSGDPAAPRAGEKPGLHHGGTTLPGGERPQASPTPPSRSDGQGAYSCPMHPEIVRDKPGECPKCGMPLVHKDEKERNQ